MFSLFYSSSEVWFVSCECVALQVKDQKSCSSSWAFSATGALEAMLFKNKHYVSKLSEQQLLDCSEDYGNRGCYGGLAMNAFRYIQGVGGSCLDSGYPYLAYVSC